MIGKELSQFKITAKLGEGGMGEVYLAEDTKLKRKVALKVLPAEMASDLLRIERFQREAEAVAALNHPNIIQIYSVDEADGVHFLTMELVEGKRLDEIIPRTGLPVDEFFEIAIALTNALAAAHAKGVTHRDLKPSNIMIATEDRRVKILDFGLAKLAPFDAEDSEATQMATMANTQDGALLGTMPYMSPEQLEAKSVDSRSDIFSLGIVLHEMATGKRPFAADSPAGLISSILMQAPAPVTQIRAELPPPLDRIAGRCLEKRPEDRYQTVRDIEHDLQDLRDDLASGTVQMAIPEVASTPRRRPPARVLAAAAAGIVVLVALSAWMYRSWPLSRPGDPAVPNEAAESAAIDAAPLPDNAFEAVSEARVLLDHYYREGNVDRAIRLFEHALALDPDNATAYAGLAHGFVWKNVRAPDALWLDRALDAATSARDLADQLAASHVALGVVMRERGETDAALDELRQAVELDPLSAPAHRELGVTLAAAGDTEAARNAYDESIRLDAESWLTLQRLGQLQYESAEFESAESSYRRALELAPDFVAVHRALAAVYYMQARYDESAAELQRALEIEPTAAVYTNLGTLQFFLGRYGRAVDSFEEAVALGANSYFYWGNLGDGYRWAPGRRGESFAAYERALELGGERLASTPDDAFLMTELALYRAKAGEPAVAVTEMEAALEKDSSDPWILAMAAVIYELAERREEALDALGRAVRAGYSIDELQREPELIELRKDAAYHRLIQALSNQ